MMLNAIEKSIVFLCCLTAANAARILGLFPLPAKSHFACNHAIMKSLRTAGHQVTMITPFPPEKKIENFTYITPPPHEVSFVGQSTIDEWADMSVSYFMDWGARLGEEYCLRMMKMSEIQDMLHSSEKLYDVIFAEHLAEFECYVSLAGKLNIPFIATLSLNRYRWADQNMGVPGNPAVIPLEISTSSVEMSIIERMENIWNSFIVDYYVMYARKLMDRAWRNSFSGEPLYRKEISLIFYNNHASILPRPNVPNVIDVGGIHVTPAQPLPKGMKKFIEEARHGVILFTFGSVVKGSSMPSEQRSAFLAAFASIPQRVIWKYEKPIENLPANVMISSWLPQRDILDTEHKNVVAFMSHCGQSGMYEAIVTGTPVVTVPLFADQRPNAALLHYRGVGINLDFRSATKETILVALKAIINDTRYYQRMQELSRVFKDRPMTPEESVVYWTEYVIRHNGASHLRALGADMPLYKYLMLDVIALVLIVMSSIMFLIYTAIRKISFWVIHKSKYVIHEKKKK